MNKSRYLILSTFFILITVSFGPTTATAFSAPTLPERQFPFSSIFLHLPFHTVQLCPKTITAAGISVSVFLPGLCDDAPPPPEEPEDPAEPEDPTLEFSADPDALEEGDSSTLAWEAENADTCAASDGWDGDKPTSGSESVSPTETTTYTLTCEGEGGEVMQSVIVTVIPAPEPEGTVVINEIMYDPAGSDSGREWIEIKNEGDSPVDLSGWRFFEDNTNHNLTLKMGNAVLPPDGYAIIADNDVFFLTDWPDFDGILFDSAFSLSNTGETLAIKDGEGAIIDEVTYTSSQGAAGDGNSLHRVNSDEWIAATPTPGEQMPSPL
ncbi:hypothetical protein A3H15_03130 [Candidatus Kaiserbacteria bacterium RIFCSPLOWO2_12_FULL_50_28]|uniref:LTD domain-containing protein n=1 Tax=Candidatus Kaiserbacteria bacterium RIFCSPLOWO2_12_FULL_50_28 TaxID=1798527 RepID=A0A1F6FRG8_9BACT|nr:MAG: hypothetical protein A3H15_03130 [Candidatus Kaiserbacteria bacterium RIFCSPLOWO2_12_FULL_50_28]